jgi:hypothetical protein
MVALEAGNSAHVDVVAAGLAAVSILVLATARTTRRTILGGILLGLAIATKPTPALTIPALLARGDNPNRLPRAGTWRRRFTIAAAASSAFIAVYVPHLLAVGSKVIGFLPGYLQQENYTSGTRYGIIGLLVTGPLASAMAVLILAAVALAVVQFGDPGRPWQGALVMTAAALAVTTPHYQWYALLLVMLVAFDGRPEWLAFAAGAYYAAEPGMGRYTPPYRLIDAIAYGVPVLVVAAGWLARRELARRELAGRELARRELARRGTVPAETLPVEMAATVAADNKIAAIPALATAPDNTVDALPSRAALPKREPREVRV